MVPDPSTEAADPRVETGRWQRLLLPASQCKSAAELTADLDPGEGDTHAKRSRFWTLLVLSAVIATAGVIADSTATVIGAMIIAPLATPIMGTAWGIDLLDGDVRGRSWRMLLLGTVVVIAIGAFAALFLTRSYDLLANSQISGRTSPTIVDLIAAVATGFAGAIGLVRRDVSDVLPGVAVAISLVPPLAVCGVCLGQTAYGLAFGAFLLFVSNVVAMVIAGTVTFSLAFRGEPGRRMGSRRRAYVTIGSLSAAIILLLGVNTLLVVATTVFEHRITVAADQWLSGTPEAEVLDVSFEGNQAVVTVLSPADPPPTDQLVEALQGKIPSTVDLVVAFESGKRIDLGDVG